VLHYFPSISGDDTRFVLVHSGDRILPELDEGLGVYAQERLEARGIEFALGTRLAGATDHSVLLADDTEIPACTLVWTAGNRPSPVLDGLPFERNRAGAVVVDSTLRVQGYDNVWGVGDCAAVFERIDAVEDTALVEMEVALHQPGGHETPAGIDGLACAGNARFDSGDLSTGDGNIDASFTARQPRIAQD
jgi:NADH dehydrogenase FAD-containing subunit